MKMPARASLLWPTLGALALRVAVVVWAAGEFPAAADGAYFDTLAHRMAEGLGYSWGWPDGTVTSVAHYPVGYPAFLAAIYKLFGHSVQAVGYSQALLGSVGVLAFAAAARRQMGAPAAVFVAWALALHPALWLYTPAVMSEGVSVAWLGVCAWLFARAAEHRAWAGALGLAFGAATLLRPQFLIFAPVFGVLLPGTWRARLVQAAAVSAIALLACVPWTLRNCHEMHSCALVSVNGGWNLAIGAQSDSGAWQEIQVPEPCQSIWDEAGKDACFGKEAIRQIRERPKSWLSRMPAKLHVTFDYAGAAPWYLHVSNAARFDEHAKFFWGAAETVYARCLLAFALWASCVRSFAQRGRATMIAAGMGAMALAAFRHVTLQSLFGAALRLWRSPWSLERAFAAVTLLTALTHAAFFGAGRYGLVAIPALALTGAIAFLDRTAGDE